MYYVAQNRKEVCCKCCFMEQAVGSAALFSLEAESFYINQHADNDSLEFASELNLYC